MAFVDLNDAIIAQVRDAADIVDFIQQATPLKLAGTRYKGLCPFHREKTPSFTVDRSKGLFYCFGCGTGGDVFKFLMVTERFTFPEAVEHGRNGFIVPKALLNHLGQACLDVLSLPPEERAALGTAARQRIEAGFQAEAEAAVLRRVLARAIP